MLIDENAQGCFLKYTQTHRRRILQLPRAADQEDQENAGANYSNEGESLTKSASSASLENLSTIIIATEMNQSTSTSSLASLTPTIQTINTTTNTNTSVSSSPPLLQPSLSPTQTLKFRTLTDLVVHYSKNPLKTDNFNMNVHLTHPALSVRF